MTCCAAQAWSGRACPEVFEEYLPSNSPVEEANRRAISYLTGPPYKAFSELLRFRVALGLPFVFLPNGLIDDCLGIVVGSLPAAVVADVHGNRDTAENITFVSPLLEGDLLIAPDQVANLAKNTALDVTWRAHDPQQPVRNYAGSLARF